MNQGVLKRLTLQAGDEVFKKGEKGKEAYVVQEGPIEIPLNDSEGVNVVLATTEKGGISGEMALIDDQPRMAAARARAGSTLIVIVRTMFHGKLAKCDPFIRGLLSIFVKNIRSMVERQLGS